MSTIEGYGVVYFALGERYLAEAALSAASVRQHMPGLRTAIFCDGQVPAALFDMRDRLVPGLPMKRQKMQALLRSPFERTLYLDTDTLIADPVWELFDLLGPCPSGWCRSAGPQLGSELAPAATAGS